tara:strand:+ start:2259 stop:2870 length:612 start_codon:yes stop_codon:yes gene_type:complete
MHIMESAKFKELDDRAYNTFLNSLSGAKPAFLIGSGMGDDENVAIFNSITHLGANPPLLGFVQRPTSVERHTYQNILKYGYYSFNLISGDMYQKGHQTSARYAKGRSEFKEVGLTALYRSDINCPFVEESPLHIALELFDDIKIKSNNTHLIIGRVLSVSKVELKNEKPTDLDFESLNGVNVSGLSDYYSVEKLSSLAYAKDK